MNQIRPAETRAALEALPLKQNILRIALDIQDGKVAEQRDLLQQHLQSYLQPNDVLITTFVHDGHPDHEITGQVTQQLATELNLACIQVLIWAWHWATPGDTRIPWSFAHQLRLTEEELQYKSIAARCFKSQLELDPTIEQAAILPEQALQRLYNPGRCICMNSNTAYDQEYFDALYALNQEIPGNMNSVGMNSANGRFVWHYCRSCALNLQLRLVVAMASLVRNWRSAPIA